VGSTANWDAIQADAVATMSRYVQFDTTNPPGNELPAAEWLRDQLRDRGITRCCPKPTPRSSSVGSKP
jgi:acetylornithine deacetylase/succinyl-diaminopimelate desuccinylase-like protein